MKIEGHFTWKPDLWFQYFIRDRTIRNPEKIKGQIRDSTSQNSEKNKGQRLDFSKKLRDSNVATTA